MAIFWVVPECCRNNTEMIPEYQYPISREYSRLYWTVKALWRERDLRFYRQSLRNNISQMREERKKHDTRKS